MKYARFYPVGTTVKKSYENDLIETELLDLFENPSFGHSPNKIPSQVLHFFRLKPYKNAILIRNFSETEVSEQLCYTMSYIFVKYFS